MFDFSQLEFFKRGKKKHFQFPSSFETQGADVRETV